jgi:hypothetical protein
MLERLNLTPEAILVMVASMTIVEGGRLIARARNNPSNRKRLSFRVWAADWLNWATLILNLLTCFVLLSIRDSVAQFGGMEVGDHERFDLFFAAVVGSGGQGLWKIVLKASEATAKMGGSTKNK